MSDGAIAATEGDTDTALACFTKASAIDPEFVEPLLHAAELHVWPGGFHACDQLAPNARLSKDMTAARDDWMARLLGS